MNMASVSELDYTVYQSQSRDPAVAVFTVYGAFYLTNIQINCPLTSKPAVQVTEP